MVEDGFDVVACKACSLVFVANPPTDEERARLYSFEAGYHEGLVEDAKRKAWHTREAAANLKLLQRHRRAGRLLDIGCSTGLFLKAAREAGWPGEGLEYSADSSRVAVEEHGLNVHCGELRADTFPPGSFDVVTLWDVIEHVPDPRLTLTLLHDVVSPGGLLALKTPNARGLYPAASRPLARHLKFWGHVEPPGHLYQFGDDTLQRMVREAGFEVVAIHQQRIPVTYSFGEPKDWFRSMKWAAYCLAFIPMALIGPWIGRGDDMVLIAKKPA